MDKLPNDMTMNTFNLFMNNIDKILSLYNKDKYQWEYFGGEPLLNWKFIKETLPLLKQDPRCSQILMISNLLDIDEEKIEFFIKNNIHPSFSFDGLWNEFNRPLANGSSSLRAYEKKKDLIKRISPNNCKTMISPLSLGSIVKNAKYLADYWGFNLIDFTLVRDDIWSNADIEKFKKEIRELSDLQIEYMNNGRNIMFGLYYLYGMDLFMGKKKGKRPFGCFVGDSGIGLMPNGIIYPCARFGSNNKCAIYNLNTDYFYEDNFKMFKNENNINPQKFNKCQKCDYYIYCNAGCTYSQMKNNFKPLDSICKLYDIIYNEVFYLFDKLENNELFISRFTLEK